MTNGGTTREPVGATTIAGGDPWGWLPTGDGAIRRDLVSSVAVKRFDGDFEGGATELWFVEVRTAASDEPITLRPHFLDPWALAVWVDRVFPGACLSLLPPRELGEIFARELAQENPRDTIRAARRSAFPFGSSAADAIRTIGDGLAGGNAYEPFRGGSLDPRWGPVIG